MSESDFDYFERRAAEEILAAEHAVHSSARQSHLELASRYSEMAKATRIPADILEYPSLTNG